MKKPQIAIEADNGSTLSYNIDSEIMNGLYSTTELNKVQENIQKFNIQIEEIDNQVATKMSKRNSVVIVTILIDNENMLQYLISKDLNIDKFKNFKEFPAQIKPLIIDAYKLTNEMSLRDLL